MDCTWNRVQVGCRPIPESSGLAGISLGSLRGGKQPIAQWHFCTLKFSAMPSRLLWPLGNIGGATAPPRVHPRVLGVSAFTAVAANRKWLSEVVPRVPQLFSRCMGTAWGLPSQFPPADTLRTALPVRCRHIGKRWDWPSQTWNSLDSSKNPVPHTWNHWELTPCSMDE